MTLTPKQKRILRVTARLHPVKCIEMYLKMTHKTMVEASGSGWFVQDGTLMWLPYKGVPMPATSSADEVIRVFNVLD